MYNYWNLSEERIIIELYRSMTVKQIANILGRNKTQVSGRIRLLKERGLLASTKNNRWTDQEDAYILSNMDRLTRGQMGIKLGRSEGAVRGRIYNLLKASVAVAA